MSAHTTLRHHTCGYYCTGARHAVECIAKAHLTADEVAHGYRHYVEAHGWRVVEVRPAPEVLMQDWLPKMAWGYNPETGQVRPGDMPRGEVVGWLIWIEPSVGEDTHAQ